MNLQTEHLAPRVDGSDEEGQQLDGGVNPRSRLWALIQEVAETILLAVLIWLLVNFATARYVVDGNSMEPNLHTGQFLIISRLSYLEIGQRYELGSPQRGDVVVFHYPDNPRDDYIKRIIGLPGETVTIEGGQVYINGELLNEPYLPPGTLLGRQYHGKWVVPEGSYFVLGDNRANSSDSRRWGMLERQHIIGKAWLSYWPPQNWGGIPHYDYGNAS